MKATRKPYLPLVVLEMSEEEAMALFDITHSIAGDPSATRRRVFDDIQYSLRNAGVPDKGTRDYSGHLTFRTKS